MGALQSNEEQESPSLPQMYPAHVTAAITLRSVIAFRKRFQLSMPVAIFRGFCAALYCTNTHSASSINTRKAWPEIFLFFPSRLANSVPFCVFAPELLAEVWNTPKYVNPHIECTWECVWCKDKSAEYVDLHFASFFFFLCNLGTQTFCLTVHMHWISQASHIWVVYRVYLTGWTMLRHKAICSRQSPRSFGAQKSLLRARIVPASPALEYHKTRQGGTEEAGIKGPSQQFLVVCDDVRFHQKMIFNILHFAWTTCFKPSRVKVVHKPAFSMLPLRSTACRCLRKLFMWMCCCWSPIHVRHCTYSNSTLSTEYYRLTETVQ